MTLPAGHSESIFQIRAANVDPDSYHLLDTEARFRIEAEGCSCSVLIECWIADFKVRPRVVKACEPIPGIQCLVIIAAMGEWPTRPAYLLIHSPYHSSTRIPWFEKVVALWLHTYIRTAQFCNENCSSLRM